MSNTHFTVFITAIRIATLGRLLQGMGLDGPPDDLVEHLSQLEALGTCINDLGQQIVDLLDSCPLEQVETGTEVAS